jgi:UPF0176 protein
MWLTTDPMKRVLLLGPLLIVLAACNSQDDADSPTIEVPSQTQSSAAAQPAVKTPPAPKPTKDGPCPYLDTGFVEETNGQHIGDIKTSAGKPPACFFYRPDGGEQMVVRVYRGKAPIAKALVDKAAPVATSNPASLPGGWSGGAQPTDDGAVYAVSKGPKAVIVATNQEQTIKAKVVAQQAITSLGL